MSDKKQIAPFFGMIFPLRASGLCTSFSGNITTFAKLEVSHAQSDFVHHKCTPMALPHPVGHQLVLWARKRSLRDRFPRTHGIPKQKTSLLYHDVQKHPIRATREYRSCCVPPASRQAPEKSQAIPFRCLLRKTSRGPTRNGIWDQQTRSHALWSDLWKQRRRDLESIRGGRPFVSATDLGK
jgi:hypothetical protein